MKQFELKGLGLEEMSHDEQLAQDGGVAVWAVVCTICTIITIIDWTTDAVAGWNSYEEETIERHQNEK